ncbi:MAG: hypothetical protein H6709_13475 [Kofleriaceae bacterium]|nr:hypothetical protein [Myxococcales bacterium]MCB9561920.1 hypothetical protein [Kofleriaceae bacterium]MCB9573089.1 hypothetical protein [Kofleriaceae bacterium]
MIERPLQGSPITGTRHRGVAFVPWRVSVDIVFASYVRAPIRQGLFSIAAIDRGQVSGSPDVSRWWQSVPPPVTTGIDDPPAADRHGSAAARSIPLAIAR